MLSEAQCTRLQKWCDSVPEIAELWLFGSRVRCEHQPESDIDLAVYASLGSWVDLGGSWKSEIEQLLPEHSISLNRFEPGGDSIVGAAVRQHGVQIFERKKAA